MIFSFNANAAFYFNSTAGSKLTVTKDMGTAVYIDSNGVSERYTKRTIGKEQIDNRGRPYMAILFDNEKCTDVKDCKLWLLALKSYVDKSGGAIIMFFDESGKVVKSEDVFTNAISSDQ